MARHQERHRDKRETRNSSAGHQATRRQARAQGHNGGAQHAAAQQSSASAHDNAEPMQQGIQRGAHEITAMSGRTFETWMQGTNETMRRMIDMNTEIANWSREQLDDSINAVRSLAQCRSVGDLYGVQIGLMRMSMEKSMRHAGNVFNLVARAMVSGTPRTGAATVQSDESSRRH